METDASAPHPTPDEARAALADVTRVKTAASSAMTAPWPWWFHTCLAVFLAAWPFVLAGALAEPAWVLSNHTWMLIGMGMLFAYGAVFPLAAIVWRNRVGMAPRPRALPIRAIVSVVIGMMLLVMAAGIAFVVTHSVYVMLPPSIAGAALGVAPLLLRLRRHRA